MQIYQCVTFHLAKLDLVALVRFSSSFRPWSQEISPASLSLVELE